MDEAQMYEVSESSAIVQHLAEGGSVRIMANHTNRTNHTIVELVSFLTPS
jgi:hypothetical protein